MWYQGPINSILKVAGCFPLAVVGIGEVLQDAQCSWNQLGMAPALHCCQWHQDVSHGQGGADLPMQWGDKHENQKFIETEGQDNARAISAVPKIEAALRQV